MVTFESRTCQNCHKEFSIEPEDFKFYEKIQVPPPTWCWECRLMRKMARRNERTLYKRKCDSCEQDIISMYPADSHFKIYCNSCWWSDKWDSLSYGRYYNFSKFFFQQFMELSKEAPRMALFQKNPINSPYTNHSDHNKNCYLAFNNGFIEDVCYSKWVIRSKDVLDSLAVFNSELIYESRYSDKSYKSSYLLHCGNCLNSSFLYDCKNCKSCFLCSNLRNRNYYFANQPLTKEEYKKQVSEADLGSFRAFELNKKRFFNEIILTTPRKFTMSNKVVNSTGDNLYQCKNLKHSFNISESEDTAYCLDAAHLKNCYDTYESAFSCELQYECHGCNRTTRSKFSSVSYDNYQIEYSEMCHNSNNLFGCIGLRHKQYCILNKQYSKEEYEKLVPKIIEQMNSMPYTDKKGRVYKYGEFFPPEISPFSYNESVAQEYFPLTKEQAVSQGYSWKDPEERNYQITMKTEEIPDNIKDADDSILEQVIECANYSLYHRHYESAANNNNLGTKFPIGNLVPKLKPELTNCTTAFRIIKPELEFLRKMNLPLPRLCPNCRHYQRLKQRNPLKLWHRQCQCGGANSENGLYQNTAQHFHQDHPCPNEFETTYAPERPEIVYCEACYLSEVV